MNFRKTFMMFFIPILLILQNPVNSMASISIEGKLYNDVILAKADETYQGTIILRNPGGKPQEVTVSQTDYESFLDGKKRFGEAGKLSRSNANWITFSPKQLTISSQGTSEINYSIKIPNDKMLIGTYWSMLMIRESSNIPSPETKPEQGKMKIGIKTTLSYGYIIATHIKDTGTINLNYIDVKLIKEANKRVFQADMENTGEKMARPLLYVELYNEDGIYVGKFSGERKRIYPGMSARFNIDLTELPKGKYKAMVMADCGGDDIFGATYNIECKDEPTPPVDPAPK